jgi:hypothetical protein
MTQEEREERNRQVDAYIAENQPTVEEAAIIGSNGLTASVSSDFRSVPIQAANPA